MSLFQIERRLQNPSRSLSNMQRKWKQQSTKDSQNKGMPHPPWYPQSNHSHNNKRTHIILHQQLSTTTQQTISNTPEHTTTSRGNWLESIRKRHGLESTHRIHGPLLLKHQQKHKTSTSWVNSIIKVNLEVHLTEWKNYCNLIQEVQPNTSKQENQLHSRPNSWDQNPTQSCKRPSTRTIKMVR